MHREPRGGQELPSQSSTTPRVLYGYSYFKSAGYPDIEEWHQEYFSLLRKGGFQVDGFCLTLNPPGPRLTWPDLDRRWRWGDRELLTLYENLEEKLVDYDVFINGPGINLHPRFVEQLPVHTVYQCFDDPESSEDLSKPVAAAYDICLVGNVAEVETYRDWGVKRAEWTPMGLMPGAYPLDLTADEILNGNRDIDFSMFSDRLSAPRRSRMDALAFAFPNAHFYGSGWPRGSMSLGQKQLELLRRTKIGPNIHNSTGPINFRMFQLPANGVMQLCDNRSHLATVYDVGKEIVGFDSIEECIDLCRYYLAHDRERREIAAAGWQRAMRDYTEEAVFQRVLDLIRSDSIFRAKKAKSHSEIAKCRERQTIFLQPAFKFRRFVSKTVHSVRAIGGGIKRRGLRSSSTVIAQHDRNFGVDIGEWSSRAMSALDLIRKVPIEQVRVVADIGCGRQTLRDRKSVV